MSFLERFGIGRSNAAEKEPVGPIEDIEGLLRLAEKNSEVQVVLDTYEQNMEDIANRVTVGGGSPTPGDKMLMNRYAETAAESLQGLGYEVSPEIIGQSF